MHETFDAEHRTRMIFLGESALADGFRLIGFETVADPDPAAIEQVLRELEETGQKAFVVIGAACGATESPVYRRLREEGGRVVILRVPPLRDPSCFRSEVDDRVERMMGGSLSG